jgi:hypothetical protein
MGKLGNFAHELLGPAPKSQVNPPRGAKQVCNEGKAGALNSREKKRRAAPLDDAPVDLGNLKVGINLCCYLDQLALTPQDSQKLL